MVWNIKDRCGEIVYVQNEAIAHFCENYSSHYQWTAFIDVDEFIFSESFSHLGGFLDKMDKDGVTDVLMIQKKFADRYMHPNRYVTEITSCIDDVDTRNWSPKHIIRNDCLDGDRINYRVKGKRWGIHNIPVKRGKTYHAPPEEIRFNHYNVNAKLLNWMKEKTVRKHNFSLNAHDYGMKKHHDFINRHCLKKPCPYNHGGQAAMLSKTRNKEIIHLIFNEPLSVKNLTSPRFVLRMVKELFRKMWK